MPAPGVKSSTLGTRPAMPRLALIDRPRLLERLQQRFHKRVVVLRAGAGFGKTTLLGQALEVNDVVSEGQDVWVDLSAHSVGTHGLAQVVLAALGDDRDRATMTDVANAVLQHAPQQVALIFDNLHRLERDSVADAFESLLNELPSNGHVVASGRADPPFRFRRLLASGNADLITESDLSFSRDDTQQFAQIREVGLDDLGPSGWPALLELRAIDQHLDERHYVAEEVLASIEPERLSALRRLALLRRFDDAAVEAVGGYRGTADALVAGLPLVNRTPTGEVELHELWPLWLPPLSGAEHRETCRLIADLHMQSNDPVGAFDMYCKADELNRAMRILRDFACDYDTARSIGQRHELLALIPDAFADHAAVRLIEADVSFVVSPQSAGLPLERALAAAYRDRDDELVAQVLLRKGEILYRSNAAPELAQVLDELRELGSTHVGVRAAAQLIEIWLAMSTGRMAEVAALIAHTDVLAYEPTALQALSFRGLAIGQRGDAQGCLAALGELPQLHGRHAANVAGFRTVMLFVSGQMTAQGRQQVLTMLSAIKERQSTRTFVGGSAATAIYHFAAGEVETARSIIAAASDAIDSLPEGAWARISFEVALATSDIIAGDEAAAAERLGRVVPAAGPFDGIARHIAYMAVVPLYLLLPRTRTHFDADDCGLDFALGRQVAHALVALRESSDAAPAAGLPWRELDRLRTWVTEPHLLELAVGAVTLEQPDASAALTAMRYDPHAALNKVSDRYRDAMVQTAMAETAEGLLKDTPERPTSAVRLEVLGPTRLVVDGEVLSGGQLRNRLVELLHLLVEHRTVTRDRAIEEFWPELDPERARNNLRVTLSLLVRLFEPNRRRGAPPWHVRSQGETIELVASPVLEVDVDEFRTAMARARELERQGRPLDAQREYMAAVDLYRGDYFQRTEGLVVGESTRVRLRLDVIEAATRAAALLTASGRPDKAIGLARRAVEIEPLDEAGHSALLAALGAAGLQPQYDLAARECRDLFESEGLRPTAELMRLLEVADQATG